MNYISHHDNQLNNKELGEVCGTIEGEQNCRQGVWWGNRKGRNHSENLGLNGTILKCTLKKYDWKACNELLWLGERKK